MKRKRRWRRMKKNITKRELRREAELGIWRRGRSWKGMRSKRKGRKKRGWKSFEEVPEERGRRRRERKRR